MTAVTVIQQIRNRLMTHGWCKNSFGDGTRRCLIGAYAETKHFGGGITRYLAAALPLTFDDAASKYGLELVKFNDHPDTTFSDVMALLDTAELLAKSVEAAA